MTRDEAEQLLDSCKTEGDLLQSARMIRDDQELREPDRVHLRAVFAECTKAIRTFRDVNCGE